MEFYEVIRARKSCRDYTDGAVSEQQLARILEAARLAPSWKNQQCWRYIVVSDPALRAKLGEAMRNNPCQNAYTNAPYIIVQCASPDESGDLGGKPYYMLDCGISMEHLCLAAANEGLGTCWVGWFDEDAVRAVLNVPEHLRITALTPLGCPSGAFRDRSRKPLEQIVTFLKA